MPAEAIHLIDSAGQAASALSPIRRSILTALRAPDSASGLSRRLDMPRQKINYHMKQLEEDGLIRKVDERQARGFTEILMQTVAQSYLISPRALGTIGADPADIKDRASSAYLMAAAGRVIRDLGDLRERADRAGKRLATMTIESNITFSCAEDQRRFAEELTRATAALIRKYHAPDCAGGRSFKLITASYQNPAAAGSDEPARPTDGDRTREGTA